MALELRAAENDDQRRLDRVLRKSLDALPLSAIHRLIRTGKVRINGKKASGEFRVRAGDTITVEETTGNSVAQDKAPKGGFYPEGGGVYQDKSGEKSLSILYEDRDLLILNKPRGVPVHGQNSLDTLARAYLEAKLAPSLSFRPGPLHRLDSPTSGILAFSASLRGAREFTRLLREGKLKKYYLAVVQGEVKGPETWEDLLVRDKKTRTSAVVRNGETAGKERPKAALTLVQPLLTTGERSLLLLEIRTGRTHQIRLQAASRGRPLWGDRKYGGAQNSGGIFLHALLLVFPGQDNIPGFPAYCFAPPPRSFLEAVEDLFRCSEKKLYDLCSEKTGITVYNYECK
ncbi:MAG: RluA family pseudouridine synthase [Spirochaetaceae bacterium]|jgi:23S rRNA pseudouridine955/2504/2580 synthase|nr:RluA family pseudouridine synthase [Spirochaetaceae bacterium]